MNPYENGVIKYEIDFQKYENGVANEVIRLLDNANLELAGYIKKTRNVTTKARYKDISKKLREVASALKEKIGQKIDVDSVIDYELKKEKKLFGFIKSLFKKKNTIKGEIDFKYPTVEQIKTSALFRPATDNLTFDSYLNGIEAGLFNTWDSAVRTGYLTGIPTNQIVSNVMGGVSQTDRLKKAGQIEPLRNAVYGNTRTLLQSFAEETRERVYKENEEYFGDGESDYKYEYLSTLDARTCLVCGNYDGKKFKSLEDAPHVPQHRNCRCLIIPYFKIEGDTRASKDGQVSDKVTFSDWLEEQDEKTQKEVLGATRFKMYQDGVKFEQFVDNGEVLTLEELKDRVQLTGGLWESVYFDKMLKQEYNNFEFEKEVDLINKDNFINHTDPNSPYRTNCAECAHAFELRMRGYDVVAKPTPDNTYLYNDKFLEVFKKPKPIDLEGDIYSEVVKLMQGWGNGARAEVRLASSLYKGHLISAVNDNGNIRFIDTQSGIYNASYLFNFIKGSKNYIIRTDKLKVTKAIKDYVEKRSKK